MMKRKISAILITVLKVLLALIVLAVAALPAAVINTPYGYLPVIFIIMLALISLASMFILKHRIDVESTDEYIVRRRGEEADVKLRLLNRSIISCPKAVANVFVSDLFGDYNGTRKAPFTVAGRDSVSFGFDADMSHIGIYSVGIDKITVYDLLGIFHTTIPVKGKYSACIMPKIRHMEELSLAEDITAQSNNNTRVIIAGGTDYSGVRGYVLGDPMKQIHWKLSAHTNEYMTKLQENNRQQEYAVILDFASIHYEDRDVLMDVNDTLIETALSLITDISSRDNGYKLIYCDRNMNIKRSVPAGRDNDMELISSFAVINEDPDGSFPDACMILEEEAKAAARSTNVIVVTSRITPQLIQEMISVHGQHRSPEMFVVVPAHLNSEETAAFTAPLKIFDEYEIPYYVISTDVNRSGSFTDDREGR